MSVCQLLPDADVSVIVTTPQDVAVSDVRRSINFCHQLKMPVLGVVENMSGFICPHCNARTDIFKTGGGETMAKDMGVPFLGHIPIDPEVAKTGDEGMPYTHHFPNTEAGKAFNIIIQPLLELDS